MAALPTFEERKRALLKKCDHAFQVSEIGRNYTDKHGEVHANPDSGGMVRCIELAARLMGVLVEAERAAKNGDGETRGVEIEQLVSLLKSIGYSVEKAA
jgi:hypothetical protein